MIYLDHAAATPLDQAVLKAMQPYFTDQFYNPSATYLPAVEVRRAIEKARATVAHWMGARPASVIFTAGGTEANNLAVHGIMRRFPAGNIVTSPLEHDSVLAPAADYDHRAVKVQADGRIDLEDLRRQIDDQTVLVSVMYANNEIGTVQPLREVSKIIETKRRERQAAKSDLPLYFHSDAAQAANYLDLHAARLGVDLMTINGGKIYGPKQSGVLYVKPGLELRPLISGGGQERGSRAGTENVPAVIGLAAALDLVQSGRREETARLQALQKMFFELVETKLPPAVINGSRKWRLPNNVHLTLPGQDNERLLIQLEQAGILAAAGSACGAASGTPSHVLTALGLSDETARASLRLTMGRATAKEMVGRAVTALSTLA
jgi:cysteine desulfurase